MLRGNERESFVLVKSRSEEKRCQVPGIRCQVLEAGVRCISLDNEAELRLDLRRLWRLTHTFAGVGQGLYRKKMLKRYDRSQYVFENKQNIDKMPDKDSDIYVEVTRVLQKNAPRDGNMTVQFAFLRLFFVHNTIDICLQS